MEFRDFRGLFSLMKLGAAMRGMLLLLLTSSLQAGDVKSRSCRLIVDASNGAVILREGPCDVRRSPCSTFKLPLAVMGFDAGILNDEHTPAWDYLPEYNSSRAEERQRTDPTSWESISVVWYSQKLTQTLGMTAFQKYVDQFDYGNRDLSGDKEKNNGLTHAWLMSSLLISPDEQAEFLQKFLHRKLGVSDRTYEMTAKVLPQFKAEDGWILTGKTGSGFQKKADGTLDRTLHEGWFVGWATKGERRYIFVESLVDDTPNDQYAGLRCRETMIRVLPEILREKERVHSDH